MFIFFMEPSVASEFYQRCIERNLNTESERTLLLVEMIDEGYKISVSETQRSKEEYVSDLSKHFNVMSLDHEKPLDTVWCKDSENSEEVLMDRKTNKPIARKDKNGNIIEYCHHENTWYDNTLSIDPDGKARCIDCGFEIK